MDNNWIPLQSIPPGGAFLVLADPAQWQEPLREFGLDVRVVEPLRAELSVFPQERGVLFRGRITGRVVMPCNRCADDSEVVVSHCFDSFEPYPGDSSLLPDRSRPRGPAGSGRPEGENGPEKDDAPEDADEAVIRNSACGRGVEINPAALAWEEFSLALPLKPLCREDCKGLCPVCGSNNNSGSCSCANERVDLRLAAPLRGLTIKGKKP